jgi:hypothetical protein
MNLATCALALLAVWTIEQQKAEVARLEKELGELTALYEENDDFKTRLKVDNELEDARGDGLARLLEQIARAMPPHAVLERIVWTRGKDLTVTLAAGDATALARGLEERQCTHAKSSGNTVTCAPAFPRDFSLPPVKPRPAPPGDEQAHVEDRLIQLTSLHNNAEDFRKEQQLLRRKIAMLRHEVPDEIDPAGLQKMFAAIEGPYVDFHLGEASHAGWVDTMPIQTRVTGPFGFAAIVADSLRIKRPVISFISLTIENPRMLDDERVVDATFTLETYRYRAEVAKESAPLKPVFDPPARPIYFYDPMKVPDPFAAAH